jgi:4'-phosphopantetheinyl transferase
MQINANEIHVWMTDLTLPWEDENEHFVVLSNDEIIRAKQYHFIHHKRRFTVSRSILRHLLAGYLNTSPESILLGSSEFKKPYVKSENTKALQFNLSHSGDLAIYAFTLEHPIGIDIEKTKDIFSESVAMRFFSKKENEALNALPLSEKVCGFYRIWSRKEALVKAIGKGLAHALPSFSVSAFDIDEIISLENKKWSLRPITIRNGYQSAIATTQTINSISCWNFFDQSSLYTL